MCHFEHVGICVSWASTDPNNRRVGLQPTIVLANRTDGGLALALHLGVYEENLDHYELITNFSTG